MFDLIIGLGNPGLRYKTTRHNVGFIVVDALYNKYGVENWKKRFGSEIAKVIINNKCFRLVKPMTYMNNSGNAVVDIVQFYKIPIDRVLIIYDDLDLNFLRIKFKVGSGNSSHNGVKSIYRICGNGYGCLRFGVSNHYYNECSRTSYVLSNFSVQERLILFKSINNVVHNIGYLLSGSFDVFMSLCIVKKADYNLDNSLKLV